LLRIRLECSMNDNENMFVLVWNEV